jgi:uncharacterized 2Fe-2S/4Fe-4S cluster protein (DUF4445 family)
LAVTARINAREIEVPQGVTLIEIAEELGIHIQSSCQQQGKCRECLVEVVEGMGFLSPRSNEETALRGRFRLACKAEIRADSGTVRCNTLRRGALRIEESAHDLAVRNRAACFDPAVKLSDKRVLLGDSDLGPFPGALFGLAIDLGTTTVVVRLVDLLQGGVIASQSFENPQRFAGSDVMSRIRYDGEDGNQLLRHVLLGYLAEAIRVFPCRPHEIYETVVAGNTTMRDLFFGLDVQSIGVKPFRSLVEFEYRAGKRTQTAIAIGGDQAGFPMNPRGRVYGLPLIGSHVGADAAACLLAVNLQEEESAVVVMDIGTNTELVIRARERLLAASCPAGPAFEGGGVTCGMPALEGAIERVKLTDSGPATYGVIGDNPPEGICGSGLVDLLSELVRTGQMNDRGRLTDGPGAFDVDKERSIYLTEEDISNLAQAKAANVSGIMIAMKQARVEPSSIDRFYLCGAFAKHIDLEAAKRIGLLPDISEGKVFQLGNAAIEGATTALLSMKCRRRLEEFVREIKHLELETDPDFFNTFVDGCLFRPFE